MKWITRRRWHPILFIGLLILSGACSTGTNHQKYSGATPLEWSVRLADSEMARRGDSLAWSPQGRARWDYAAGLFTLSLLKLDEQQHDPQYLLFSEKDIGSFI